MLRSVQRLRNVCSRNHHCNRCEFWLFDSVAYVIVLLVVSMEPAKNRKTSPLGEYFDQISSNKLGIHTYIYTYIITNALYLWEKSIQFRKVKCMLDLELGYNNNASSMLRHYLAFHENKEGNRGGPMMCHCKYYNNIPLQFFHPDLGSSRIIKSISDFL